MQNLRPLCSGALLSVYESYQLYTMLQLSMTAEYIPPIILKILSDILRSVCTFLWPK